MFNILSSVVDDNRLFGQIIIIICLVFVIVPPVVIIIENLLQGKEVWDSKKYSDRGYFGKSKILVGFAGRAGHGKDTCVDYLTRKYGFHKLSFATPLKDALKSIFLLSDEQLHGKDKQKLDSRWGVSFREIAQFFGTQICRSALEPLIPGLGEDIWVKNLSIRLNQLKQNLPEINTAISDVRYKNEEKLIRNNNGFIIKIIRKSKQNQITHIKNDEINEINNNVKIDKKIEIDTKINEHISESTCDLITDVDLIIENDGTLQELYQKLESQLIPLLKHRNPIKTKQIKSRKVE